MKKIFLMMGVAALALSSCSQEEVLSTNTGKTDGDAISFHVRSKKASRSMEYSTYNLDKFMVYGFKGNPDDGETVTDYFDNPVLFSDLGTGLFTSEKTYYYPTDDSWLYFAAYAPSSLEFTAVDEYGGLILDNFTVNSDITKQIDIICASGAGNLKRHEPDMELTFTHALSKVYVSTLRNNDDRYKYEIIGVKFANIDIAGDYVFRGEKSIDEIVRNGVFGEDGYIMDYDGNGHFWKPAGEQTHEIVYMFDEPIVLDKDNTEVAFMSGDDTEAGEAGGAGCFMMIPQQLNKDYYNADGVYNDVTFGEGMSYVAFLMRITYEDEDWNEDGELETKTFVAYPYANGMGSAAQTVGGVEYGWAAFPLFSLWIPGNYTDYWVDFTKGAGFVAPGAADGVAYKPIFDREIQFTQEVFGWSEGQWTGMEQDTQVTEDRTDVEDPLGAPRK